MSEIRQLKYSQDISKNCDCCAKNYKYRPLWIYNHLAFKSEPNSCTKAVRLAQFLRVCICINAVVENSSDYEEDAQPHESKDKFAEQVNYLYVLFALDCDIPIKVRDWTDHEDKDLKDQTATEKFLLSNGEVILVLLHNFLVLEVDVRFAVMHEVLVQPKHFVVVSGN